MAIANCIFLFVIIIFPNYSSSAFLNDELTEGILNSMKNLTGWAIKEERIFKLAKSRHETLKKELQILEEYIEDYKDTTEKVVINSIKVLKTPEERAKLIASGGITSYRMIYRYAKYLVDLKQVFTKYDHKLEDMLLHPSDLEVNEVISSSGTQDRSWPSLTDLNDAMQALLHLHEINDFPLSELHSILSPETNKPAELNAFHCVQIGLYALFKDYFALAVEWLEWASKRIINEGDTSIHLILVNNYLTMVIKSHNEAFTRLPEYDYTVFAHNISTGDEIRYRRSHLQYEHFAGEKATNFVTINFWGLCKGNNLQTQEELAKLKCYYDQKSHPAWKIGPLKVEVLSELPPVIQIYDVLGDKMISEILIRSQANNLSRSGVVGEENMQILAKTRTSVNAWVDDDDLPELTKKVEMITGLKVYGERASEKLQVVEYVFGRYYAVHTDPLFSKLEIIDPDEVEMGDRVATVLFYLNEVEAGGYTPFSNAGTFAPPIKGSAIFWFNLYKNGTMRDDTWHGACPVISGHKIVANKWIRYAAQFETFKCSLDPNE